MYTRCQYQYKRGDNRANICGKPVFDDHYYCRTCCKTRCSLNFEDAYSKCKIQQYDDNHWRDPLTNFIFYKDNGLIYIIGAKTNDGIRGVTDEEIKIIEKHGWIYESCDVKWVLDD